MNEFRLKSFDGLSLRAGSSVPENPRGIVFLCHGLGEHLGRYDHVVAAINDAGFGCYALDLRGHGESDGNRGHIDAWSDYVGDLATLFEQARREGFAERPWLQLGHSMGGLVSVHAMAAHGGDFAGLALSGPLLGIHGLIPEWRAALGRFASALVPWASISNELDPEDISRDSAVVAAYRADPLVHDRVSARFFTEMTAALERAHEIAPSLGLPLLLMHGSADQMTDPEGSRRFADAYGGDVELEILDGFYHEVFNELDPSVALGLLMRWLDARA